MTFENLLFTISSGTLTITINRPDKLNALNKKTVQEIGEALKQGESNNEVRGIIITGSGTKSFVAGADISEFLDLSNEQGRDLSAAGHAVFNSIENCSKPVIAAVNGFALGGGCELAMACHLRVASDNARFGQPEVNLGLIPGYGGTQRLIQHIGKGKALELLMTAEIINAEEAFRLGLVNYVTTKEQLMNKCIEILEKIRSKSPIAIQRVVKTVNAYFSQGAMGFEKEIEEFGKCFGTADFKEGTKAFLEKRKANFSANAASNLR